MHEKEATKMRKTDCVWMLLLFVLVKLVDSEESKQKNSESEYVIIKIDNYRCTYTQGQMAKISATSKTTAFYYRKRSSCNSIFESIH